MIKITQIAKQKLISLIKQNNSEAAWLYLKGGGCNGFSYKFKMIDSTSKLKKHSEVQDIDENYKLYLCDKSLMYLLGTEVDYIEDIMGSRFNFKNPLIESKCGCGTSISFK